MGKYTAYARTNGMGGLLFDGGIDLSSLRRERHAENFDAWAVTGLKMKATGPLSNFHDTAFSLLSRFMERKGIANNTECLAFTGSKARLIAFKDPADPEYLIQHMCLRGRIYNRKVHIDQARGLRKRNFKKPKPGAAHDDEGREEGD